MTSTGEPQLRDAQGTLLGTPFMGAYMYSGGDLVRAVDPPSDWGGWELHASNQTLRLSYHYEIDLESCVSSSEVCDWVFQVSEKGWADDKILAGLVRAFNDILEPQANLCSFGENKALTKARIRKLCLEAQQQRELGLQVYGEAGQK